MQIQESVLNKKQQEIYKLKQYIERVQHKNSQLESLLKQKQQEIGDINQQLTRIRDERDQLKFNPVFTSITQPQQQNMLVRKIEDLVAINEKLELYNHKYTDMVARLEWHHMELQNHNLILKDQIEMLNLQRLQNDSKFKLLAYFETANAKLIQDKARLVDENHLLRQRDQKIHYDMVQMGKRMDLLEEVYKNKVFDNLYDESMHAVKDARIKELEQDNYKHRETIADKDKVLARLDQNIFDFIDKKQKEQRLFDSKLSQDESVSIKHTLYYINSELKKRSNLLLGLREKYLRLINTEEEIKELIKNKQSVIKNQDDLIKKLNSEISRLKDEERRLISLNNEWKKRYTQEFQSRLETDQRMILILHENQAFHQMASVEELKQMKSRVEQFKQQYKSECNQQYPEYRFTTVLELINKNRELMKQLRATF